MIKSKVTINKIIALTILGLMLLLLIMMGWVTFTQGAAPFFTYICIVISSTLTAFIFSFTNFGNFLSRFIGLFFNSSQKGNSPAHDGSSFPFNPIKPIVGFMASIFLEDTSKRDNARKELIKAIDHYGDVWERIGNESEQYTQIREELTSDREKINAVY